MDINYLKKVKWINILDWSSIPMTDFDTKGNPYISKSDILSFITNYISEFSRKYDIPCSALSEMIEKENEAFYSILDNLYDKYTGVSEESREFEIFKSYFKVPDLGDEKSDPVNELLVRFKSLTDIQKLAVLSELKLISIKVTKENESNYKIKTL